MVADADTYEKKKEIFPWKRRMYSDDDVRNMMKKLTTHFNLKQFKSRLTREQYTLPNINLKDRTYNGKSSMIVSLESDYEDWNVLSDMFNEENRLMARLCTQRECAFNTFFDRIGEILPTNDDAIVSDIDLREKLYHLGVECTSFRPNVMCTLVGLFGSTRVLDFSSGWGDRLIAAIACGVDYVGIDPNERLQQGYDAIRDFFQVSKNKYVTIVGRAQDIATLIPEEDQFDLVFTSPPYFNYEIYNDGQTRCSTEDEWLKEFLYPSIIGAWNHLQDEGYFAININQTSRSQSYVVKMIEFINTTLEDSKYLGVISYVNERSKKSPQPIFVWKKSISCTTIHLSVFEKTDLIHKRALSLVRPDVPSSPHPSIDPTSDRFKCDPILIAKYEIENNLVGDKFVIERQIFKGKTQRQNFNGMILPP